MKKKDTEPAANVKQKTEAEEAAEKKENTAQEPEQAEDALPDELPLKLARLENDLAQAVKTRDEYLDMARRLQADFENYKRRNATARADAYEDGRKEAIAAILPVIDNLERAIAASENNDGFVEGVIKIQKQFLSILEGMGVTEIEALNQPFDPELHHAVMQEEKDGVEPGTVLEVLQKGYRLNQAILRYSMVKVAK